MEICFLAALSKCSPAALWRVFCRYGLLAITLSLLATSAVRAESLVLDPAFQNSPQFGQRGNPWRVTSGPSGKVYVTLLDGTLDNDVISVNNVRGGAVVRLNADGTLDPTFNVGTQFEVAFAVIEQANGQVLVGASDSTEGYDSGTPLYHVFRLNADGKRDSSYRSPVFRDVPRFMTLQPDGKLLVVSQDTGSANGGLVGLQRLNSDGSLDTSFAPVPISSFFTNIVVDASGRILVGGNFSTIAGQPRPGIVRLLSDGTLDSTFVPSGFTAQLRGIAVQTQGVNAGKIVIAGALATTGSSQTACPLGVASCALLRLNSNGSLDTSFTLVNKTSTGVISGRPRMLGILPDDRLLIVSSGVARFNADGSLDSTYNRPVFSLETFWMDTLADDRVYVPIIQTGTTVNGSAAPQQVMRFNANGTIDPSFAPGPFRRGVYPRDLAILPDGRFLIWGAFDSVGPNARIGAARFNTDGSLDNSYSLSGITGLANVTSAGALADGRLIASVTLSDSSSSFARFTATGAFDPSYTPDSSVVSGQGVAGSEGGSSGVTVLPDGKALLWAQSRVPTDGGSVFFKRLNVDGSLDTTFVGLTGASALFGAVYNDLNSESETMGDFSILGRYADGRLIVAATTGPYPKNATSFTYTLLRLNADGTRDGSFGAPSITSNNVTQTYTGNVYGGAQYAVISPQNSPFSGALPQADGSVIVYGSFTSLGGQAAAGIARLTSSGAIDSTFSTTAGAELRSVSGRTAQIKHVASGPNGKYWISGLFDTFGGQSAPGLARLNADGKVDSTFSTPLVYRNYFGGTKVVFDAANRPMVLGSYLPSADGFPDALHRLASQQLDLAAAWNLAGNGYNTPINVASAFGNSANVTSVWKWIASTGKWAFYSPTLGDGGAGYAAGHGYAFLTTINPGEGFWLNAKQAFSVPLSGNPVPTSTFSDGTANALPSGWSLIAIGDNKTPTAFANAIAVNPPAAGAKVATSLATLWAWDPKLSGWYFFAPSLVNAGTQSAYISSQKYLDFGATNKTLTPTTGFWVNRP